MAKSKTAPVVAPNKQGQFEVVAGTLKEAAREPSIQHTDVVKKPAKIETVTKDRDDGKPPIELAVHYNSVPKQSA